MESAGRSPRKTADDKLDVESSVAKWYGGMATCRKTTSGIKTV